MKCDSKYAPLKTNVCGPEDFVGRPCMDETKFHVILDILQISIVHYRLIITHQISHFSEQLEILMYQMIKTSKIEGGIAFLFITKRNNELL